LAAAGMSTEDQGIENEEMLPDYNDLPDGKRGLFVDAYRRGHKVIIHMADGTTQEHEYPGEEGCVMLEPDVRRYFPDSESVNKALRSLIELIPKKPEAA
jgi:hypothetical protein